MKRFLALDRPLAVFDIESTGLSPRLDRIVELSVLRVEPDGSRSSRTWRFNPGVPIPPETTALHGITDEMVASEPKFADKAEEVLEFFRDCDLGGFGLSKLDIPLLDEEFARCGLHFNAMGRRMFDALRVYHAREPRDLSAAMRFYCGEELVGAHGAAADAEAALRVLEGEFEKYPDLPVDPEEFDRAFNPRDPSFADREGRLKKTEDGRVVVNFGKKRGQFLDVLAVEDPSFLRWIVNGDFAHDTKRIVRDAIDAHRRETAARAAEKEARARETRRENERQQQAAREKRQRQRGAGHAPAPVPAGFEGFAAALDAALGAQKKA